MTAESKKPVLTWHEGPYGGGFNAKARHFDLNVTWRDGGYIARVTLGGGTPVRSKNSWRDPDEAKVKCESMAKRMLREALAALGDSTEAT